MRLPLHRATLVGALGGVLASAGRDLPLPYLMGVTGHAFRLTLNVVFSPDAPTEINFHDLLPLWENLGVWFRRVSARLEDPGYAEQRADALRRIRESVERGLPAVAYDLMSIPEYGLVVGYDEGRLACLTMQDPEQIQWMDEGAWPPVAHRAFTRAEAITLMDAADDFDGDRAAAASLRFAVDHFWSPPGRDMWLQHGKGAYEFWIAVLASPLPLHGDQPGLGHSYNLLHLHRCRRDAVTYLGQLADRYPQAPSLGRAAERYEQVTAALQEAIGTLPFPGERLLRETDVVKPALAACLRRALAAETEGIGEIERALRALR